MIADSFEMIFFFFPKYKEHLKFFKLRRGNFFFKVENISLKGVDDTPFGLCCCVVWNHTNTFKKNNKCFTLQEITSQHKAD